MTRDEAIQFLDNMKHAEAGRAIGKEGFYAELLGYHIQALNMAIKALEQQTCGDAVSRQAVLDIFADNADATRPYSNTWEEVKALPPVNPQPKWIPVSERLPKVCEFVNCTCHSLIDDREDWVVETCYIPQPHNSPYSDWGNIPMLNWGHAEVIAWMHRDIPEPYKAESEG